MKKYDDAKIDALLKESAAKKEKPDDLTKERLYEKLDDPGTYVVKSGNGRYLRFVTAALAILCIVLSILLFVGNNKHESVSVESDDNKTVGISSESKVISQPTYLKAMKYEWYSAEKTKSFVYDRQSEEGRYFELTLNIEDECYSFDIDNHSSSYGGSYNSKKDEKFTTNEQKKLAAYRTFYEGAMEAFVFYDDEFRKLLLEKYEEMYEFAGDYPSYLQEGIKLAIDDIKADKRYVFSVHPAYIEGKNIGYQIFRADIKDAKFQKLENDFDRIENYSEIEAVSLFDENIRTKVKVIEWVWKSATDEEKDYSLFWIEIPAENETVFHKAYYAE